MLLLCEYQPVCFRINGGDLSFWIHMPEQGRNTPVHTHTHGSLVHTSQQVWNGFNTHTHTSGRAQARPPNLECLPSLSTYTIHSLLHFSLYQESLCCNHSLACLTCTTGLHCATPSLSSPFNSEPLFNVAPCCKLWGAFCYRLSCGYRRGALGLTTFHLLLLAIFMQHESTVIQLWLVLFWDKPSGSIYSFCSFACFQSNWHFCFRWALKMFSLASSSLACAPMVWSGSSKPCISAILFHRCLHLCTICRLVFLACFVELCTNCIRMYRIWCIMPPYFSGSPFF